MQKNQIVIAKKCVDRMSLCFMAKGSMVIKQVFKKKTIFGIIFSVLVILGIIFSLNHTFNLSSNWVRMLDAEGKLLLKQGTAWIEVDSQKQELHPVPIYEGDKVRVSELEMKRTYNTLLGKMLGTFARGRILIFEFSPENHYAVIANPVTDSAPNASVADPNTVFAPMTAKAVQKEGDYNFVVNANFYAPGHHVVGELILEGEELREACPHASGFFRVINGKPYAGPKSLFAGLSGNIDYSCQAFPSVMNHGAIFDYFFSENPPYKPVWGKKTYRNLVGMTANGKIVFILSHARGMLSVKEISIIARNIGLVRATTFDGGVALQYEFAHGDQRLSFSAFNTVFYAGKKIDEFFLKKYNFTFFQRSPVFIGIKF